MKDTLQATDLSGTAVFAQQLVQLARFHTVTASIVNSKRKPERRSILFIFDLFHLASANFSLGQLCLFLFIMQDVSWQTVSLS